jgi:hypothetical protein
MPSFIFMLNYKHDVIVLAALARAYAPGISAAGAMILIPGVDTC